MLISTKVFQLIADKPDVTGIEVNCAELIPKSAFERVFL